MYKKMMIIQYIAVVALTVYFLPFWWPSESAAIWVPGLALFSALLILMVKRTPIARYVGLPLMVFAGLLPLKVGCIAIATLSENVYLRDRPLYFGLAFLSALLGAALVILGIRFAFGKAEKEYFRRRQKLEQNKD